MRHPHADILHAYAEGAEIEMFDGQNWKTTPHPPFAPTTEYRIRPSDVPFHLPLYRSISLRDYFAAAALTGMYAGYQGNAPEPEQVANDAYFIADEMLKEREK